MADHLRNSETCLRDYGQSLLLRNITYYKGSCQNKNK